MSAFKITIDGREVEASEGQTVLDAARSIGIDIPTLCYLEKCGPATSCLVCLVKINGRLIPSCGAKAVPGMVIESETDEVREARRTALELLFSDHVGDCLAPCHRLCPLQLNIPGMIRQLEAGNLGEAVATVRQALPLPAVLGRLCNHPCEQGCRRGSEDDPAAIREMERFIADHDLRLAKPHLPPCGPTTGRTVAVVGAGPCGLAAAYYLARQGHAATVIDRNRQGGGTLRAVNESDLPAAILDAEIGRLQQLGVAFRYEVELGKELALADLLRDFNAVLLAVGEASAEGSSSLRPPDPYRGENELAGRRAEAVQSGSGVPPLFLSQTEAGRLRHFRNHSASFASGVLSLGVTFSSFGVHADSETFQTSVPGVFAAGSAVKAVKLLVRAMAEGKSAAECIHRYLIGEPVRRSDKPFSSIMGRIEPPELQLLLRGADPSPRHVPCDVCAGLSSSEATGEAKRCLHCDCRSSGRCDFQHYAQVYGANAGRFRTGPRAPFEQQLQPGGVIYEPGKCILCGICVRLTEAAREPLGLTFIGRGFDVRIATPFNRSIEEGMQKAAAECVKHCPTGALAFKDGDGKTTGQGGSAGSGETQSSHSSLR